MMLSDNFLQQRKLETLVENQTTFTHEHAEMHIFETHQKAEKVFLKFHNTVLASMLTGKKVMHLDQCSAFDFMPGESLILPPDEIMCIDFPEADMGTPTRCLAMTIMEEKIQETIQLLNETSPKADGEWLFVKNNFHFTNDPAVHRIIQRLVFLFTENHTSKDIFTDFMLRELIIRVLQADNYRIYTDKTLQLKDNHRLAFIIHFIRQNLDKEITVALLSEKACMSESNFHRVFKAELGMSPTDFINNERIKLAKSLLKDPGRRIKEIYTECGFNSLSYFNRVFKKWGNVSPREFQDKYKVN